MFGERPRIGRTPAVQSLLEGSARFIRRVTEATPEMLYLFESESGDVLYANRMTCSTLGCKPHELHADCNSVFASVLHPDDVLRVAANGRRFANVRDDNVIETELRIRDARGDWRWLHCREIIFQRTASGSASQILGTAQDITDRNFFLHTACRRTARSLKSPLQSRR